MLGGMNQMHEYLQVHCQGIENTISPDCPCPSSWDFPHLQRDKDLICTPQNWGHQPQPQWCHSKASLQLPTGLPGNGLSWAGPTHGPTSWPNIGPSLRMSLVAGAGAAVVSPGFPLLAEVVNGPWLTEPILSPTIGSPLMFVAPHPQAVIWPLLLPDMYSMWTLSFLSVSGIS